MRITRLGEGVDATGKLSGEAIDRCLSVLAEYREVMDRLECGPGPAGGHVGGPGRRPTGRSSCGPRAR